MKDITNEDGIDGITVNFFVKGKTEDVWKYISDVEHLNKLFPAVQKTVKVKEIDANNIIWNYTLKSSLGIKIFNVKRTNDEKNGSIKWKRTDGDMKYYGGGWKIKASDQFPGWVDCTYSNFVDAGWFLPFALVKRTSRENAEAMVPSLRNLIAGK
jgi:ribosome-associated toxin RatA of RatAB toxin-antitoxin module